MGFTVTDAFLISKYQCNNNDIKKWGMTEFADCVAWDLINNEDRKDMPPSFIPSSNSTCIPSPLSSEHPVVSCITVEASSGSSTMSPITTALSELDGHRLEKVSEMEGGKRLKRNRCSGGCTKKVLYFCAHPMCRRSGPRGGRLFFGLQCDCFRKHKNEMNKILTGRNLE